MVVLTGRLDMRRAIGPNVCASRRAVQLVGRCDDEATFREYELALCFSMPP